MQQMAEMITIRAYKLCVGDKTQADRNIAFRRKNENKQVAGLENTLHLCNLASSYENITRY